jgi:hypothetical protein
LPQSPTTISHPVFHPPNWYSPLIDKYNYWLTSSLSSRSVSMWVVFTNQKMEERIEYFSGQGTMLVEYQSPPPPHLWLGIGSALSRSLLECCCVY